MITQRDFHNALTVFHNIDSHQIEPRLSEARWEEFCCNPIAFYLCANYETQAAIWTAAERRLREAEGIRA